MDTSTWLYNYREWQKATLKELADKGHTPKERVVADVNEDGSVYFGNLFFTEPGYVTPWEESEFYVDN